MRVSELLERIKSLVGDDDVDIYLEIEQGEFGFTPNFKVYLDQDGDLNIRF